MGGLKKISVLFLIGFRSLAAEKTANALSGSPEVATEQFVEFGYTETPGAATALRVRVNLYNAVNLPLDELSRAEREAARIFHYAGIQLTWVTGLLRSDVKNDTPSGTWNPTTLQLRIWSRATVGKRPRGPDTLGFCLSLEKGDAVVLADAIQDHVGFGNLGFADLLGLAMAHELGHLLLRSASHSVTGMMRARWTEEGVRGDERYFRFTAAEAKAMRQEVSRRMNLKSTP